MTPVRWSNLKYMADCPAMYKHVLDHPIESTAAMRFGSIVHEMVLGKAHNNFVVYEGDRRGNAWKEFKEAHEGFDIVTADEWARAAECADAVKADPVCGKLLKSGIKEHRLEWKVGDRECAGTPDLNGDVIVDLKVTAMANPLRFAWHVRKMLWHAQVVWYADGATHHGYDINSIHIVAVTPKPPYLCVAYELTPQAVELGRKQWRLLFERLLVCEASNQWPGYAQSVIPLDLAEDELDLIIDGEEITL